MDKGCPAKVENNTPDNAVDMIISNTPNCPLVPSKKRLPKVMAGASAAMKRYLYRSFCFKRVSQGFRRLEATRFLDVRSEVQDGGHGLLKVVRCERICPVTAKEGCPPPQVQPQPARNLSRKFERTEVLLARVGDVPGFVAHNNLGLSHGSCAVPGPGVD